MTCWARSCGQTLQQECRAQMHRMLLVCLFLLFAVIACNYRFKYSLGDKKKKKLNMGRKLLASHLRALDSCGNKPQQNNKVI